MESRFKELDEIIITDHSSYSFSGTFNRDILIGFLDRYKKYTLSCATPRTNPIALGN